MISPNSDERLLAGLSGGSTLRAGGGARSVIVRHGAWLLFLLTVGPLRCGGSNDDASSACVQDENCQSGFCDRDVCVSLLAEETVTPLGRECFVYRDPSSGEPQNRVNVCGGYLCLNARCRSCRSDAECNARGGTVQASCQAEKGLAGKSCGRVLAGPEPSPDEPPPPDSGDTPQP